MRRVCIVKMKILITVLCFTNIFCISIQEQDIKNTITEDDRRGSGYEGDKVKGNVSGAGVKVSETKKRGIYLGGGVGGYHKGGIPGKHQYYYPSGYGLHKGGIDYGFDYHRPGDYDGFQRPYDDHHYGPDVRYPIEHGNHHEGYGHKYGVGYGYNPLALKGILLPLAGIALLGAAAALSTNPVLLQLGVLNGRRRRSTRVDEDKAAYPQNPFIIPKI